MGLGLMCASNLRSERSRGWRIWSSEWWRGHFEVQLASFPLASAIAMPTITSNGQQATIYKHLLDSGT